jgi:hypothetical protein
MSADILLQCADSFSSICKLSLIEPIFAASFGGLGVVSVALFATNMQDGDHD